MNDLPNPTLKVNVNGAPLSTDVYGDIIDLRVSSSLHSADRLSLRLRDPYFELLDGDDFLYGDAVAVSMPDDSGSMTQVFSGSVVGLDVEPGGSDRHELVVVALDDRYKLGRSGQVRTFVQRTVGDIVRTVATDLGLGAQVGAGLETTFENLVQAESDFEFLDRLAVWADAMWWVDGTDLQFQPSIQGSPVPLTWGDNLMSFSVTSSSAGRPSDVSVRAWDPASQQAITGQATAANVKDLGTTAPIANKANSAVTGGSRTIGSAPFADASEGEQLAKSLMKIASSSAVSLVGECTGAPALRSGGLVDLQDVGTRLAGSWTVTEVEHVLGADRPYTTRFVCGGREGTDLVDLLHRSQGGIGPTRLMEPAIGTVSNTQDPDRRGRVKVRFPSLGDDVESSWARVAGLGAGNRRGLLVVPHIDDEVLVVFEHGSWRRPVVVAGLWSDTKQPPPQSDVIDDGKPEKAVRWQTVGGHVIELHEGSGSDSYILLELAGGATSLRLAGDAVELKTDQPLTVSSSKNVSVESTAGDLSLKANNITIDAKQNLTAKGLQVSVEARAALGLKGAAGADLKADGPVNVQSSAITSVKGSLLKLN